ncbi:MAG TPA: class I SAM-dependent methyltransferase [Candidatus Saccharimonadales bacterium]|nr:class I SAM-dependent methyltransferase [Candidatus Saccharimonadales bacterium]
MPSLLRRYKNAKAERRKAEKRRDFFTQGQLPWSEGYAEHKVAEITRALTAGHFGQGDLAAGYGFRLDERIIEYPWLFSRLPKSPGLMLDAGSVLNFSYLLQHPALEAKKLHICTLAPEADCFWSKGVSYIFADLRKLPYRDCLFDWVVCLSTIEHVGMDNTMLYSEKSQKESNPDDFVIAVRELRRVLKPGGTAYFSVPFGQQANLGWQQIFNQKKVEQLICAFEPCHRSFDYFYYHPLGWQRSNAPECATATVFDIHHAKGYDADFAAAARAVCCLELKKGGSSLPAPEV